MSFDWREFLMLAHELQKQTSEGAQRTCLGRAYYYVYTLGLARATALGFERNPRSSTHKQLWDWCQKHKDQHIKQMGITGNRMKSFRVEADYYNSVADLVGKVRQQLTRAQEFETLVATSNGQPPPPPLPL